VDSLPYVVTSGWASGVNVYATVLVTGLLGRVGGVDGVPDVLQRTDVLVLAGGLWGVEFVADKIPYVDNAWDAVHTFIRPTIGAIIGALLAGEAQDLNEAFAAVLGGSTALASHAAKAGLRLAVNASPEPVSNIVLSLLEDGAVVGVILFSIDHPYAAVAVAIALMAGAGILLVVLYRAIRRTATRLLGGSAAPT
jgi:hypothetical protein